MYNPYNYQGGTATIDGQPASMNGQSRIPEYVANGVAHTQVGVPYAQPYGYASSIPGVSGQNVINPMTGLPVNYPGVTNTIPTINPITGFNGFAGYPQFAGAQYPVTTPWGMGATYPTIPNIYNTIPATTFGVPAIQPFFGAGMTINPITGTYQPAMTAINPFAAYSPFAGINPMLVNPYINNPWVNPMTAAVNAQAVQNAAFVGVPPIAAAPVINTPATMYGTAGLPNTFAANPFATTINPAAVLGAINPAVCNCPIGVATTGTIANTFNRGFGINPVLNTATGIGHNPFWNINPIVNPAINNLMGFNTAAHTTPWNTLGATPWNVTGITNPWVNAQTPTWANPTNWLNNLLSGWNNPAMTFANPAAVNGFGFANPAVAPVVPGLFNTTGCWPTCGI